MKMTHNIKPTRKEVYAILADLKHDLKGNNSISIDESLIDTLINQFAPSIPGAIKQAEKWVAKAVACHDVRYYLNYLYVENGTAVATDGHRMHWCATDMADGFYDPKTLDAVDCSGRFPDWQRVVPTTGKERTGSYLTRYCPDKQGGDFTIELQNSEQHIKEERGTVINQKYLHDACNRLEIHQCDLHGADSKIVGEHSLGQFVIMSIRT